MYDDDNQLLETSSYAIITKASNDEIEKKQQLDSILARVSFVMNITFLFANAFASILSGSLSVIRYAIFFLEDVVNITFKKLCFTINK